MGRFISSPSNDVSNPVEHIAGFAVDEDRDAVDEGCDAIDEDNDLAGACVINMGCKAVDGDTVFVSARVINVGREALLTLGRSSCDLNN